MGNALGEFRIQSRTSNLLNLVWFPDLKFLKSPAIVLLPGPLKKTVQYGTIQTALWNAMGNGTRSFSPDEFLAKIDGGKTISTYRKDEVIFAQGEPADSVFFLRSGKIKITVVSEQGKEAVVAILGAGEFFGEGSLAGQIKRMATSSVLEKCVVVRIPKPEAMRVLHDEPSFSAMFMTHLLARNIRIEEDLVDQLFNSSEKRLARALLLLANFGKDSEPQPIIGKITQATLAEMIGTTRSRVSSFMNKFRNLGLIEYNGTIKVHASLLNLLLHDKPEIRTSAQAEPIPSED